MAFTGLPPIGPFNLIGGGSPAPSQWPNEPVAEDTRSWTSGYDSVPFVAIAPVKPATTPVTADASFNSSRVSQLFYDSLCTCDARGAECSRSADCCDSTDTCFGDPAMGGKTICSECRKYAPPTYAALNGTNESCTQNSDCCPGSTCQAGITVRTNCVLKCDIPSYEAAHMQECHCDETAYKNAHQAECAQWLADLGGIYFSDVFTDSQCNTHVPTWKVCAAPPGDPGDPPK